MENNNSVCYVGKVTEIKAIEGADKIELAVVGGWNSITKKDEYKVGDFVVIATTDAVIPQELSDRMGITSYLRKGQRVRTVKLKGVYSECLILDVAVPMVLGKDCMELLGIFKYEPPVRQVRLSDGSKRNYQDNPNFGVYYKFPNLKNVAGLFAENDVVQITRKIHGTNVRYGIVRKSKLSLWDKVRKFFGNEWVDYEYVYGSHNVQKGSDSQGFYGTDVWKTIAEQYEIKEKLWDFAKREPDGIGSGIILYGEIYGKGIQKNYEYGLDGIRFTGFDFVCNGIYQSTFFAKHAIENVLGLSHVPILYTGTWSQEIQDKFVFNNFIYGTKVPHEGIVIKHVSGERNKVAKVINPDYLIYGEKHNVGDSH